MINKTLRNLITQAQEYAHLMQGVSNGDVFHQKLAELIVKECCNFNYDFLESYSEACEVNTRIRKHLGIPVPKDPH